MQLSYASQYSTQPKVGIVMSARQLKRRKLYSWIYISCHATDRFVLNQPRTWHFLTSFINTQQNRWLLRLPPKITYSFTRSVTHAVIALDERRNGCKHDQFDNWKFHTFASVFSIHRRSLPRFLNKAWTTLLALFATRVMLTSAYKFRLVQRIVHIAAVGVSVTHTATSDGYVFDTVVILQEDQTKHWKVHSTQKNHHVNHIMTHC